MASVSSFWGEKTNSLSGAETPPSVLCEAMIMVFRFSSVSRSTTPMIRFPWSSMKPMRVRSLRWRSMIPIVRIRAIKPAGKNRITPYRSREAAGECGRHHRSFTRKVNDLLHHPEESQDRNRPGGHFDIFFDCRQQPAYACKDMFLN